MGSKIGAYKRAAKQLGYSFSQYMSHINNGEKHCGKCRQWKPLNKFHIDRSRGDGRKSTCKKCNAAPTPHISLKGRTSTFKGKKHTEAAKKKISDAFHKRPEHAKRSRLGIKHTPETRAKISAKVRKNIPRGKDHYNYKHGRAVRNANDRRKPEYKDWRKQVFERDEYTCQDCKDATGGNLRAHHIKGFADHPELRFTVSNGITLCHSCHELRHFKPDSIRNMRKLKRGEPLWK